MQDNQYTFICAYLSPIGLPLSDRVTIEALFSLEYSE